MIKQTKDGIIVGIRISPYAKKNDIIKDGDITKIKITFSSSNPLLFYINNKIAI